jgi:hypothetical protein
MPAPPSHPFPFTPAETGAALWAVAATHYLLERGERDGDPEAAHHRRALPGLPGLVIALRAGLLDPADAEAVALALAAVCQVRETLSPAVWAALLPPALDVLESAREKALQLPGVPGVPGVPA